MALGDRRIFVFVDNSNIFIEGQKDVVSNTVIEILDIGIDWISENYLSI